MTSSSGKLSDLSFAVFTNSVRDYDVIATSPGIEPKIIDAAHRIGRACKDCIVEGFADCVGAWPIGDDTGRVLAFRVFDSGDYLGRPHTLGLVVLDVPRPAERSWQVWQALAALRPPVPGSNSYSLPDVFHDPVEPQTAPLRQLKEWEEKRGVGDMPDESVCLCDPPHAAPKIPSSRIPGEPIVATRPARFVAALAAIVATGVLALGAWWAYRHFGNESGPRPSPRTQIAGPDKNELRKGLEGLLAPDNPILAPSTVVGVLQVKVVGAAQTSRKWMKELEKALGPQSEPRDQFAIIQNRAPDWDKPFNLGSPSDTAGQSCSASEVSAALNMLGEFKRLRLELRSLRNMNYGDSEFGTQTARLRQDLARNLQ